MKTVFILMDAFRHDYINNLTPFLKSLIPQGTYVKRLKPSLGFCERTEIFTGTNPRENGFFTAIGLSPNNNYYKKFKMILFFFSFIKRGSFLSRLLRRLLWEMAKRTKGMHPYNIPFNFLPYFSLTEDQFNIFNTKEFPIHSIFKEMEDNQLSWSSNCFTSLEGDLNLNDRERLKYVEKNICKNINLHLLYLSFPDELGHSYGPSSPLFKEKIKKMDRELETFYKNISQKEKTNFIFLGDHGMADVEEIFNAEEKIKSFAATHQLKTIRDYIYFLDSTMLRIWFFGKNKEANRDLFVSFMKDEDDKGKFLLNQNKGPILPYGQKYGDLIWLAHEGVLISPDFFNRKKSHYKGMHGYCNDSKNSMGMGLFIGESFERKVIEQLNLTDVLPFLKRSLKINS